MMKKAANSVRSPSTIPDNDCPKKVGSKPVNEIACSGTFLSAGKKCKICAKLPLRAKPGFASALAMNSRECFDVDFGLFEVVSRSTQPPENFKIDRKLADRTAESARRNIKSFQKHLQMNKNKSDKSLFEQRVVAPLATSEIKVGRLIGVGGFSSIYEVSSFNLDESFSAGMTRQEQASREFLSKHTVQTYRRYCHAKKKVDGHEYEINRFAVKRLRHELADDDDRFERAAIDLILEGQLLCTMNHPNIIGIRGWNGAGADSFRSLMYSDYFLVLDCLPEGLDERIEEWRDSLRKYRSRLAIPWLKQKAVSKMHDLLRARIQAAHDVASAIEYMHDRRIINRDIKTGNVGYDAHGILKCFDCGLSRFLPEKMVDGGYEMSPVGTKLYMATEVRAKKTYGLPADVYSYGVVLWQLLSLATPRDGLAANSRAKIEDNNIEECWLPICPCWPDDLQELVRVCLHSDPRARPCMTQIPSILSENLQGLWSRDEQQRRKLSLHRKFNSASSRISVESKTSFLTQYD